MHASGITEDLSDAHKLLDNLLLEKQDFDMMCRNGKEIVAKRKMFLLMLIRIRSVWL